MQSDLFHLQMDALYVELSHHYWNTAIRQQLFNQLNKEYLHEKIKLLFQDNKLNPTENKSVNHVAWRNHDNCFNFSLNQEIKKQKDRNTLFVEQVISGIHLGYNGDRITDIVNVGIGGSHLGNALVCSALKDFKHGLLQEHFLTAPDPFTVNDLLKKLNPKKTLWLFNSKSFTTFETITLLKVVREWFLTSSPDNAIAQHFFAITHEVDKAYQQGFKPEQIFYFDEGVGGRFSLWSSSGLIIQLVIGTEHYNNLLAGGHAMDQHFYQADLAANIPVALASLDYYYAGNQFAYSRAVIPYTARLDYLPLYLQQLEMESLGKSALCNGALSEEKIALAVWGGVGPNGQHAFHQFFYQNNQCIPIDFIVMKKTAVLQSLQDMQLAQCLAQAKALWEGNGTTQTTYEKIKGGNPSTLIILDELTPFSLGALLAMYEHKVFVLGMLNNINAFDQFGVELGKKNSQPMLKAFSEVSWLNTQDPITQSIINELKS